MQEFHDFKKFIVTKASTPAMKHTIAFFNKEVFAGVGGTDSQEDVGEDFTDELAAAMNEFGLGEDDNENDAVTTDLPQHPLVIPDQDPCLFIA